MIGIGNKLISGRLSVKLLLVFGIFFNNLFSYNLKKSLFLYIMKIYKGLKWILIVWV